MICPRAREASTHLSVGEAKVESAKFLAFLEDGVHQADVLEVAEVLLSQPRLRHNLSWPAVEPCLKDCQQRLPCPQVGRVDEADTLLAQQLTDL